MLTRLARLGWSDDVSSDTSPEQLERHAAIIRAMSSEQRAAAFRSLDRGVRRLAMAGLRHRHPEASERELIVRLCAQVHGVETARRVYGGVPEDLET